MSDLIFKNSEFFRLVTLVLGSAFFWQKAHFSVDNAFTIQKTILRVSKARSQEHKVDFLDLQTIIKTKRHF